jgi:hypothetical protein
MKKPTTLLLGTAVSMLVGLFTVFGVGTSGPGNLHQDLKYRVFCANNKIDVEQRTLEQEKNARGSNVCLLAEFSSASDADKYAEEHGGKDSDCKCN